MFMLHMKKSTTVTVGGHAEYIEPRSTLSRDGCDAVLHKEKVARKSSVNICHKVTQENVKLYKVAVLNIYSIMICLQPDRNHS
jgi:hypothetical protein